MTTTFKINESVATPVTAGAKNTPWYFNTPLGAVKVFSDDVDEWVELLPALQHGLVEIEVLELFVVEVKFTHLQQQDEELVDDLKVLDGGVKPIILDIEPVNPRFEDDGMVTVAIFALEYFDEPITGKLNILKTYSNRQKNAIHALKVNDELEVLTVHSGDKPQRKLKKPVPTA
jgi:hypothetical protein